jgi:hypothetical protein
LLSNGAETAELYERCHIIANYLSDVQNFWIASLVLVVAAVSVLALVADVEHSKQAQVTNFAVRNRKRIKGKSQ